MHKANLMGIYERHSDTITWAEQHLYGSSRLGSLELQVQWHGSSAFADTAHFLPWEYSVKAGGDMS